MSVWLSTIVPDAVLCETVLLQLGMVTVASVPHRLDRTDANTGLEFTLLCITSSRLQQKKCLPWLKVPKWPSHPEGWGDVVL
jgi:hypothetical protein